MAEVIEFGSEDGRLCGELAAAVVRYVTQGDKHAGPGRKGSTFFHGFAGDFEAAHEALVGLGVFVRVPEENKPDGSASRPFAFTMDADEIPHFLTVAIENGDPRLAGMLDAFVGIACRYDGLSDERSLFRPPVTYLKAMWALARSGYAERVGDQYRWTNLIAPAMRAAFLWDEELQSYSALSRDEEEAEAEAAWRTMPETIRHTYFSSRPIDLIAFARILAVSWKDGKWHPFKSDDRVTLVGQIALAKRISKCADAE